MRPQTAPLNYDPSDPHQMRLPAGRTCKDCAHVVGCELMFHIFNRGATHCFRSPSQFSTKDAPRIVPSRSNDQARIVDRLVLAVRGVLIALAIMLLAGCASLPSNPTWTKQNTVDESTFAVALAMDWRQTMDIARHSDLYETNPVLGMHPNNARIHIYMTTALIVHYGIARALPPEPRKWWIRGWTVTEIIYVLRNFSAGLCLL